MNRVWVTGDAVIDHQQVVNGCSEFANTQETPADKKAPLQSEADRKRVNGRLTPQPLFCMRTHMREQQYVTDGMAVGKQHNQTVDTDALTRCRR